MSRSARLQQHAYSNTGIAFWTAVIVLVGALGRAFGHRCQHHRLSVVPTLLGGVAILYAGAVAPSDIGPVLLGDGLSVVGTADALVNAHVRAC